MKVIEGGKQSFYDEKSNLYLIHPGVYQTADSGQKIMGLVTLSAVKICVSTDILCRLAHFSFYPSIHKIHPWIGGGLNFIHIKSSEIFEV